MAKRLRTAGIRPVDGAALIGRVLAATRGDVEKARQENAEKNERLVANGEDPKAFKEALSFAIYFAKHTASAFASALKTAFPGVRGGETPSHSARGPKRVDLNYSTPEMGLALGMSFKSVHFGERDGGNSRFVHNMKRNDEELRVEATSHHLRQPYAVLIAVLFLPFESCSDGATSSFAKWVEYLWPLKGRVEPDDPPDRFELVFVGLYDRQGSEIGFYEVGGTVKCPRTGRPNTLLDVTTFLVRVKGVYDRRNSEDFYFEGEES